MSFLGETYLLSSDTARRLYYDVAAPLPIYDFHNHLPPQWIAEDRHFENLWEVWLSGDHYKWRAMRTAGIDEDLITGKADPKEKFLAWAKVVPQTLRNPLYDWTHLELRRAFGIEALLSEDTAEAIWEETAEKLASPEYSCRNLLKKFHVKAVGTTDDPADPLPWHEQLAQEKDLPFAVFPSFRPDNALRVDDDFFNGYVDQLAEASNRGTATFEHFLRALASRHDDFHQLGGRLSDHGLTTPPAGPCSQDEAAAIFDRAREGHSIAPEDAAAYASFLLHFFARLNAERGWTMQVHIGALRNVNTRQFVRLGKDSGYDIIGDHNLTAGMAAFFDRLDSAGTLPKTILYNIDPRHNEPFATLIGAFQEGPARGKLQLGAAWWFGDQKHGIRRHFDALSSLGLLSTFVGMVSDSRSFLSFPRHEVFRRILCDLVGTEAEKGELPEDFELLADLVRKVCWENAVEYFGQEIPA